MENPCDTCLIKVNCTQICEEKRNYGTLIDQALKQYKGAIKNKHGIRTSNHTSKFLELMVMSQQNKTDILMIASRQFISSNVL